MDIVEPGQLRRWEIPRGMKGDYDMFLVICENPIQLLGPDKEPVRSFKVLYTNGKLVDHWIDDLIYDPAIDAEPNPDGYSVVVEDRDSCNEPPPML